MSLTATQLKHRDHLLGLLKENNYGLVISFLESNKLDDHPLWLELKLLALLATQNISDSKKVAQLISQNNTDFNTTFYEIAATLKEKKLFGGILIIIELWRDLGGDEHLINAWEKILSSEQLQNLGVTPYISDKVFKKNFSSMVKFFGERWFEKNRMDLFCNGFEPVTLERITEKEFSLTTITRFYDLGLPNPRVVFRVDLEKSSIEVLLMEDNFHNGRTEPEKRLRKVFDEKNICNESLRVDLNLDFENWLDFLYKNKFELR